MRVYSENGERPAILARVEKLGFVTFTNKDYDLNIIGERNPNGEADQFDDWLLKIEGPAKLMGVQGIKFNLLSKTQSINRGLDFA